MAFWISRGLSPRALVDQTPQVDVLADADQLATVAGAQQRSWTVRLRTGQLIDVHGDVYWAQNPQCMVLLCHRTQDPGQVFVTSHEHVQTHCARRRDMRQVEPILIRAWTPRFRHPCRGE
jgi:hypothetical protein